MQRIRLFQLGLLLTGVLLLNGMAHAECLPTWEWKVESSLTNGGGTATNYFALLTFDTQTPISEGKMKSDGGDIRFTDEDCNSLNYWIESGFNTTSTKIWVVVPSLPSGTSTVTMYYGNTSATHTNSAADVWGSGIAALFTYTEGSGTTLHDWVGGHDMTISGLTWGSGFRSGVGSLSGFSSGRVYRSTGGPAVGSGDFSALIYFYPTAATGFTQGLLGNYNTDGANGWVLKEQGGPGEHMFLTNQGGNWCQNSDGNLSNNAWHMVGGVRISGTGKRSYEDGAFAYSGCSGDARNVDNSGPFEIGRSYNGNYPLSGSASLAAVYTTALNDNQIAALHASLYPESQPEATTGDEEAVFALTIPADITIECNESTDPSNTGMATTNVEGITPTYSDEIEEGSCDNSYTISRTWSAYNEEIDITRTGVQTITVEDSQAPTMTLTTATTEYHDPNHMYHTVDVDDLVTAVSDNCSSLDVDDVVITLVTSDEAEQGNGDGNTTNDIVIGNDCRSVQLRAERSGNGNGRVYRIHLSLSDECGNETTASYAVKVRKGSAAAIEGSVAYSQTGSCGGAGKQAIVQTGNAESFYLSENYPNPFTSSTTIDYGVRLTGEVHLTLINTKGEVVEQLVNETQKGGSYSLTFTNTSLPAGTYYYVLESAGERLVRSFVIVK